MAERSFEERVSVRAPAERVWALLEDVEGWPGWTASMQEVALLDRPLAVGARARIRQPRLPVTVWTVDALVPGERFSWTASSPGLRTFGDHVITPTADGCDVLLAVRLSGPAAPVAALLTGRLVQRYIGMEGAGLARRAESG